MNRCFSLPLQMLCYAVLAVFVSGVVRGGTLDRAYSPLVYPQNIAVADFVHQASAAIQEQGEAVFESMNREGPWCDHTTGRYIFVYDEQLVTVVNAGFPEMRGRQVGAQDPRKFYACNQLLLGNRSELWAHADWTDAATGERGCKTALLRLVTAPSGARYIVGSGALNLPMERCFIEQLVDSAAAEYQAQGTNAFQVFSRKDSPFRFRDVYVFVDTPEGVEIFNPAFPEVVGQNLSGLRDEVDGRFIVREYIEKALQDGAGWTAYHWPRPGETKASEKETYTCRTSYDGQVAVVGAGLYLSDLGGTASADSAAAEAP